MNTVVVVVTSDDAAVADHHKACSIAIEVYLHKYVFVQPFVKWTLSRAVTISNKSSILPATMRSSTCTSCMAPVHNDRNMLV